MTDLLAALCLMVVIEGLVLFAVPDSWKRTAASLLQLPTPVLRRMGGAVMLAGLAGLWLVRQMLA